MTVRYAAVVDCRQRSWEYTFWLYTTIQEFDTHVEALSAAWDTCLASPRDTRRPRVEERMR